jgi:hypothetical protein
MLKSRVGKLTQDKMKIERESRTALDLARSMDTHVASDVEFYRRKVRKKFISTVHTLTVFTSFYFICTVLTWSGFELDVQNTIFLLVTFPYYENEWDVFGFLLECVFGSDDESMDTIADEE